MRTALMALPAILVLAACGGSGRQAASTSSPSVPTRQPTTATSATSASGGATIPSSPAATTPVRTVPASTLCRAWSLELSYLGGQGATGHDELGFALRNTGDRPCHTFGYPGVQFLDGSGRPLPTASTRTTGDFFGTLPLRSVVVAPGASFSFRLGVGTGYPAGRCTDAAGLAVIPPDDTASLHVTLPGTYECGAVTVSPVQPGDSAYVHG